MEFKYKIRETIIDFNGDVNEIIDTLEFIMFSSPWNKHKLHELYETGLLVYLLRENSIIIKEMYYSAVFDLTEESIDKATKYLQYLHKKKDLNTIIESVQLLLEYEIDISLTNKLALYYPAIKAYVRCGDLDAKQFFEFLEQEHYERIIIFNGLCPDNNNSNEEVFYLFEITASKEYILEKLKNFREKIREKLREDFDDI